MKIAIVGAGIFGCEIALSLSYSGHEVDLFESNSEILSGASMVNQARIHTGMHYPRDFETAKNSFDAHDRFVRKYPAPITFSLDQYYAVASHGSKTSADEFLQHATDLGIKYEMCHPSKFFRQGKVEIVVKVPESTFDYLQLRRYYLQALENLNHFCLKINTLVNGISDSDSGVFLKTENEEEHYDYVVVATYTTLFPLLQEHISEIADDKYFQYQGCEVALGRLSTLMNTGVTVMDGDFWSTMPFGGSGLHSLTSVPRTPHLSLSSFDVDLVDQTVDLKTQQTAFNQDFNTLMKDEFKFEYVRSIFTVKTLALNSQSNAARPTEIFVNPSGRIIGVFSGKIASALEAADKIQELIL